ncbi:fimbria/pilus chaperone family protein [Pseudomonas sp. SBT1-2]|uniref:fimbria/pilus chaperone family protein n=1 Tax=Pseudomonas sp. SBT1-2 TaxID=3027852 RepID=UPI002362CEA7|nr:fimbria/pilus chaperone family protein [Pseudomonas sp. SBT1-2]
MFNIFDKTKLLFLSAAMLATFSSLSQAAGMVPESTVVLVNVADGEGTMNVTNSDDKAMLLYTSLENLPGDEESLVVVSPPVARVEAGEKQLVRFIVQSDQPITTQRLKRVSFEGIPQADPGAKAKIGVTVRQNLPVLISPGDLPKKQDPWTVLEWSLNGRDLTVKNDSRYVVRLNQAFSVMPADLKLELPATYILPGQTQHFELPAGTTLGADAKVRIYPVTTYGFATQPFDAPLKKQ